MVKRIIMVFSFCTALLFAVVPVPAQTAGFLTGSVRDAESRRPLIGVNIMVESTLLGGSTDKNGKYTIEIPAGTYRIRFSMMGYRSTVDSVIIRSGERTESSLSMTEAPVALDPLIVSAGKHPQALGTTHQAVDLIAGPELVQRQSRNTTEALMVIPGIHFNEENISIRGSSGYSVYTVGSRVLLMIDGIPVLTADMGTISWDLLPLYDISRIEVVKGAGSALYGSSAMGGVINILTREPSPEGRLRIRLQGGLYDKPHYDVWHWTERILHYEQLDLSYGRRIGPVGFRLALSRHLSTGYMENDSLSRWNATGKFNIKLPANSRLDLYIGWMKLKQDFFIQWKNQNRPFEVPDSNTEDELQQHAWNLYMRYALPITSTFGLKLRISHLWFDLESQFTIGDPTGFKPGQGLGGELQADWIPHPRHHIIFGSEFKRDVSGSRYFGDHQGYALSPYIQEEWSLLPGLTSTLGLRLDHHGLMDEESTTQLSPKLGLNYTPVPATSIRITAGSGFRAATVFEKYIKADYAGFNIISNPGLKPERSWFADIGLKHTLWENADVQYSGYYSQYTNMIEPVINFLGTIQFQNTIRATIWGQELGVKSWWWERRIGLAASLAYMEARDTERDEPLAYRPRWTCVLMGTVRLGPVLLQGEYRYASRIEKVQINPLDPRVSVKIVNVRAQIRFRYMTLQLAVNNALNYHYTQVERHMAEVRNASIGLLFDAGL